MSYRPVFATKATCSAYQQGYSFEVNAQKHQTGCAVCWGIACQRTYSSLHRNVRQDFTPQGIRLKIREEYDHNLVTNSMQRSKPKCSICFRSLESYVHTKPCHRFSNEWPPLHWQRLLIAEITDGGTHSESLNHSIHALHNSQDCMQCTDDSERT